VTALIDPRSTKPIYIKGRQHNVHVFHTLTGQPDFVEAALRTFFQIHTSNSAGDVLIFLPGQEEIENLGSSIRFYAHQLPQGVMPVKRVAEPVFRQSDTLSRFLCTPCILPCTRLNNRKSLRAHHMVSGSASLQRTSQKPRLQFLASSMLSILESARKGVMSPGKPGVVDSPVNDGGLPRLTPLYRCGYLTDPRHQQIFRDATGRARRSRGLWLAFQ